MLATKRPDRAIYLNSQSLRVYFLKCATGGRLWFYEGQGARDIVDSVKKAGGVLTLQDLKNYKVRWLAPLQADIYGFHFSFMAPPSSGGIIVETALKLSELKKLETRALNLRMSCTSWRKF